MRELLLFHIYSGQLFFSASFPFLLIVVLDLGGVFAARPLAVRVARVVALLCIFLAALSGTPLPTVVWLFALGAALTYVVTLEDRRSRLSRDNQKGQARVPVLHAFVAIATVVAIIIAVGFELRWHFSRGVIERPGRLIVVGDSLASGGFGESMAWPALLGRRMGVPVVNLAAPSDTTSAALRNQAAQLPSTKPTDLVIVEIGGNDMLDGTPANEFAASLNQLLAALHGRQIVMLEFPVIPGRWRYGAIQRHAAKRHHVFLAPKRILASVLADPRNTSDGLHLTQRGHDELANGVSAWLRVN